jgi:hypothetical protein
MTRLRFLLVAAVFWGCELGTPTGGGGGTGAEGLTGIVVDGQGWPVAGAQVRLHAVADIVLARSAVQAALDSAVTNAFGRYHFTELASGRYALTVKHARGDSIRAALVERFDFEGRVDLGTDTLRPAGHATALVKSHAGEPLVGAVCGLVGTPWIALSDETGACRFEDVVAGHYTMKVTAPGREAGFVPLAVIAGHAGSANHVVLQHPVVPVNDWVRASVRGYALSLPSAPVYLAEQPDLQTDLILEGTTFGLVSYDPLTVGADFPTTHAGFRQELMRADDTTWGLLTAYRLPDSLCLPGQEWVYESILRVEGRLHLVIASDSAGLVDAWRILRSVQEWKGPGPAPHIPPVIPYLALPGPEAQTTDTVRFSWESPTSISSVQSYRLQVSTDTAFVHLVWNDSVAAPHSDIPVFLNRLAGPFALNQVFYWRVVAVGPGGATNSERRSFRPIGQLSLMSPD